MNYLEQASNLLFGESKYYLEIPDQMDDTVFVYAGRRVSINGLAGELKETAE